MPYPVAASEAKPAPAYVAEALTKAGWTRVSKFTWTRPVSGCRHSWPVADWMRRTCPELPPLPPAPAPQKWVRRKRGHPWRDVTHRARPELALL